MQPQPLIDPKFIPQIILKYKIKAMLKIWRKRSKNSKHRLNLLTEWSHTEKIYLQKLVIVRDQIKKPLLESKLISEFEQAIIFPNLDSMIQLGQQMQAKIDTILKTWNPITTVLAPTIESLAIYLKIYKQYSNNYNKADKIIQQLKKTPQYKSVIKLPTVQDYLIKPVQRPLQYKLFVTDYIKQLPVQHYDRTNLLKAKETLLKIADEINEFVEKQLRAGKMIQLENSFGNLIESTREYRSMLVAAHVDFPCKVYVFNDLLLIVKILSQTKEQKFLYLYLCGASYVLRQPDNKTFKNRLYICGTYQSIHLTFRCPEDANIASTLIDQLISTLYLKQFNRSQLLTNLKTKKEIMAMNRHSLGNQEYKWKEQYDYRMKLKIEVIGVEKRLYDKEWKIVYAVRIRLGRPEVIYQVVFYEIEELKIIERYLKEVYPSIMVPSLQTKYKGMSYDDAKTDFTKYYEYKCILIEDFLNYCLRCKQLSKRPQFLVFKLKLSQSLWDYINKFSNDCSCEACTHAEAINSMEVYRAQQAKIKKKQYQFCIMNSFMLQNTMSELIKSQQFKKFSLQQKLTWAISKQKRLNYDLQNRGQFGKKLSFHITLKLIGQDSELYLDNITTNDTCREVVSEVCSRKGITETLDFCLVYVHGRHEYYLDEDQYIYDAVRYLEEEFRKLETEKRNTMGTTRSSIFNSFSKSMDDYGDAFNDFSVVDQPKIYMRKYFYLYSHLEQKACNKNPQRYPLILAEYLRKFQEQYLLLSIEEIKIFCALFYGVQEFNQIIFSNNIFCNEEKIKKYMPESKWNFIGVEFTAKVRQILQTKVKTCPDILSLYHIILNLFGDKPGIYTQYFPSQSLDPAALGAKQKNLLIGVNHHKITVSRRFNAVSLLEFPIQDFRYRVSGDCLFIDLQNNCYRFVGKGWWFFDDLVEKYRLIYEMEWQDNKK